MKTRTVLTAATLVLATAVPLLAPEPTASAEEKEPAAQAEKPPALLYLGLNDAGAEEWFRIADRAVVVRVPGGPYLRRPYEGAGTTLDPEEVEVASFLIDKHEVTNARFARFLNAVPAASRSAPAAR